MINRSQDMNTDNETVSIIIPVYNAGKYLKRCISSLFCQTYHDLEIVLVEDASDDHSKAVCEEYNRKYQNVVYLSHNKNQGQVKTRNDGISLAAGRWMMFLDADDYLEKDTVRNFVEIIRRDKSDIVCSGYKTIDDKGKEQIFLADIEDGRYQVKEFVSHFFDGIPMTVLSCIGAKMYDLEFIKKRKPATSGYVKTNYDMAFILDALLAASSVSYTGRPYYCYVQHEGSITSSYRKEFYFRVCKARKNMLPLLKKCGELKNKYNAYQREQFGLIIWSLIQEIRFRKGYQSYSEAFQKITADKEALQTLRIIVSGNEKMEKRLLAFMIRNKKCFLSYLLLQCRDKWKLIKYVTQKAVLGE